jgi:hypothetical protein
MPLTKNHTTQTPGLEDRFVK